MTQRNLQKWQGAGNDFLVDVVSGSTAGWWTPKRAAAVCDRHFGIGADGLLVADMSVPSQPTMHLFNADGSVAEMSGNGIRCLAAAIHRWSKATWDQVEILTDAGKKKVRLRMDGDDGRGTVNMGKVRFGEPLRDTLALVKVGNPHIVLRDNLRWNDEQRKELAERLSESVGGANVEFVTVESSDSIAIKVYERGVGWTLACGTGSVASAAACKKYQLTGRRVHVKNPGGELEVKLKHRKAKLSGPVHFVGDIVWNSY